MSAFWRGGLTGFSAVAPPNEGSGPPTEFSRSTERTRDWLAKSNQAPRVAMNSSSCLGGLESIEQLCLRRHQAVI